MATQCPPEKDFYSILGLDSTATSEQIHEAYQSRARVSHPDRFDKETQPREWKMANEMLRDLNAAYATLRDVRSKSDYDQRRANGHKPEPPKTERPKTNATEPSFKSACSVRFADLPPTAQQRMILRQSNEKLDQFKLSTDSVIWNYVLIGIYGCWFVYLYFGADSAKWKSSTNYWQVAITLFVGYLIAGQIIAVVQWCQSTLKSFFYVTPLYYIKTDHDIITFWPIFALEDIGVTHNYKNGSYQNSTVVLTFEGHVETLTVSTQREVEDLFKRLKDYDARVQKAHADDDGSYFVQNDDFVDVSRTGIPADTSLSKQLTWTIRAASLVICGLSYLVFMALNESRAANKWVEHATAPPIARAAASVAAPRRVPKPPIPEQPLPFNGDVKTYSYAERVAPFEIKTSGGQNYLVKLVNAVTKTPVLTVFVRGGQPVTVDVPLGTYEVRYTWGDSWYGYTYLFGDTDNYSKAGETFAFTQNGNQVSGYTITLYPVEHGNLKTQHIESTDF